MCEEAIFYRDSKDRNNVDGTLRIARCGGNGDETSGSNSVTSPRGSGFVLLIRIN